MSEELESIEAKEALREAKRVQKKTAKKKASAKKNTKRVKKSTAEDKKESVKPVAHSTELRTIENESSLQNCSKNDLNGNSLQVECITEYSEDVEKMRVGVFVMDNVYKTGVSGHTLFNIIVEYALSSNNILKVLENNRVDEATFYRCIMLNEEGKNALEWAQRQKKQIIELNINNDFTQEFNDMSNVSFRGGLAEKDEKGDVVGELSSSYVQFIVAKNRALREYAGHLDSSGDKSNGFSFTLNNNVKSDFRTMRVENIKEIDVQDIDL